MGKEHYKSVKGFSRWELLVVVLVLTVAGTALLSVLARRKQSAQGVQCSNNIKQLMLATLTYAADFEGWLPPNPDFNHRQRWFNMDMQNKNLATNEILLRNPKINKLAPYTAESTSLYKCLGDYSEHVMSYSMSQAVGTKPDGPKAAVDGPWLDGTHNHKRNSPWRTYGRISDAVDPSPARLWVLIDESHKSIGDPCFAVSMVQTALIDFPAAYHKGAGGIAFMDGHAESHRWTDPRTTLRHQRASGVHFQPNNPDVVWLQGRTSALAPKATSESP